MIPRLIPSRRWLQAACLVSASITVLAACSEEPASPPSATGAGCRLPTLRIHLAVDNSDSLEDEWSDVRSALDASIAVAPEGALLHVYLFSGSVDEVASWRRGSEMDSLYRRRMPTDSFGTESAVVAMTARLGEQILASPDAKHLVVFISDQEQFPALAATAEVIAQAGSAWDAVRKEMDGQVSVFSIRVDSGVTRDFSKFAGGTELRVVEIERLGDTIASLIENDPTARLLRAEQDSVLLSAALEPDSQTVGYRDGTVTVRVVSGAQCGSYQLADGTSVGPGDTVRLRVEIPSRQGLSDYLFGAPPPPQPVQEVLTAARAPRVERYRLGSDSAAVDTVYPGNRTIPVEGQIVYTAAPLSLRLLVVCVLAALVGLLAWLGFRARSPAIGGVLRATDDLDTAVLRPDLTAARRGTALSLPPEAPRIRIRIQRTAWWNPSRKQLAVEVLDAGSVIVSEAMTPRGFRSRLVPAGGKAVLRTEGFVLWPVSLDPGDLSDAVRDDLRSHPGYQWTP